MTTTELQAWASAYIEFQRGPNRLEKDPRWWAVEKFYEVDPEVRWDAILRIISADPPENLVAVLAAGPLESLLVKHGEQFIARVEQQSQQDARFRNLLGGVWPSSISSAVWRRVESARDGAW